MSTVQALLNYMKFMYDSIDLGNFVISIFLDFKKAFLSVRLRKRSELEEFHMNGLNHIFVKEIK